MRDPRLQLNRLPNTNNSLKPFSNMIIYDEGVVTIDRNIPISAHNLSSKFRHNINEFKPLKLNKKRVRFDDPTLTRAELAFLLEQETTNLNNINHI